MESDYTKEAKIAGMKVQDIPLHSVVYGGLDNYSLRLIANGKKVFFNANKTYQSAMFTHAMSTLLKDQDIESIASHWARSRGSEFSSNEHKQSAYKELAKETMEWLVAQGPGRNQSALQQRVAELEQQLTEAKIAHTPTGKLRMKSSPSSEHPAKSTPSIAKLLGAKTNLPEIIVPEDEEDEPRPEDEDVDIFSNIRRGDRKRFLETSAPAGKSTNQFSTWISKLKVAPAKIKKIEELAKQTLKLYNDLDPSEQGEQIMSIAIDWGLPIALTSKIDNHMLIKIVAAASTLAK